MIDNGVVRPAKRLDIEGLRAIAVTLVVVYHLWPAVLPGGFAGVDVFFVVSGFLITSHLLDASARHGRVRLLEFWGRRARRLLPAAAVVLATTWVASLVLLPATQLAATAQQVRASALYFQNWVLARDSVDYLHASGTASPVQHFWSLSVEEQFYLGWPVLFVAAWGLTRLLRRGPVASRRMVALLAIGVVAVSFWFSVSLTASDPAGAYFVTPTRVWELGVGGLMAMLPARFIARFGRVGALGWFGLAAIVASAVLLSGDMAFPGWLALLPVGGAALLLMSAGGRGGPAAVMSVRPLVFVGGISYSVYLWHWPLIVLWQAWSGHAVGVPDGVVIAAVAVLLARATKRWVEDPIRRARRVTRSPFRSLSVATAALLPVLLVGVWLGTQRGPTGSLDDDHPGAAALTNAATALPTSSYIPSLSKLAQDAPAGLSTSCEARLDESTVRVCTLGDTTDPELTVALVGDSHAAQWSDALDAIAKDRHWKVLVATKGGCPFTATEVTTVGQKSSYTTCKTWNAAVLSRLLGDLDPDVVITSDRSYNAVLPSTTADAASLTKIAKGMATYWRALQASGISVVALRETPEPHAVLADCLAARGGSAATCAVDRSDAFSSVSPVSAASELLGGAVPVVDLTSQFCTATICSGVIGNVVVYLDNHHLTSTYTMSLRPYLEAELVKASAKLAAV